MGDHFYVITIGGLAGRKTVWPGEPIEREKGRGVVGKASSQILGASFSKSADDSGPVIRRASCRWTIYYTNHAKLSLQPKRTYLAKQTLTNKYSEFQCAYHLVMAFCCLIAFFTTLSIFMAVIRYSLAPPSGQVWAGEPFRQTSYSGQRTNSCAALSRIAI
jgi:hypothetical protein